jgi:hypothetical protein
MYFSIHNPGLLSGIMAGAVALAGASACSRSDRANAGRDSTQTGAAAPADSQASPSASASAQPDTATQPTTGTPPSSTDTATGTPSSTGNEGASSQNTKAGHRHARSRPSADRASANGDQGVAGYKAMGPDSSTASSNVSDSSNAALSDTSATTSDTAATEMAGANAPMTRDTSVALAQGDTAAQVQVDTSSEAQADTATIGDTGVILTQADTTQQAEVAVGDSTAGQPAERMHPDTVSKKADELAKHEPARVRPPEDSTEILGNVTTGGAGANADASAVGAAGVASTGNIATGADAVALMSRQGEPCQVAASDQNRDVLWDMASSPSTLNPCGTGTMTLPRIWMGEKR